MGPHLEVEVGVREVGRAVATQVPVDARRTQVRARDAVRSADLTRDDADPAASCLEDLVAEHEVLEVVAGVEHHLHRRATLAYPAPRQVVLQPTDAVEVRGEAPAGGSLDDVEHVLAVAE